jgi:hypothetical protein
VYTGAPTLKEPVQDTVTLYQRLRRVRTAADLLAVFASQRFCWLMLLGFTLVCGVPCWAFLTVSS